MIHYLGDTLYALENLKTIILIAYWAFTFKKKNQMEIIYKIIEFFFW